MQYLLLYTENREARKIPEIWKPTYYSCGMNMVQINQRTLKDSSLWWVEQLRASIFLYRHNTENTECQLRNRAPNDYVVLMTEVVLIYVAVLKLLSPNWRHFYFVEPSTVNRFQSASESSDCNMTLNKLIYSLTGLLTPKLFWVTPIAPLQNDTKTMINYDQHTFRGITCLKTPQIW